MNTEKTAKFIDTQAHYHASRRQSTESALAEAEAVVLHSEAKYAKSLARYARALADGDPYATAAAYRAKNSARVSAVRSRRECARARADLAKILDQQKQESSELPPE